MTVPQVRLVTVAVIALPMSASAGSRPSKVLLSSRALISSDVPDQSSVEISSQLPAIPSGRGQTARIPCGPSSAARCCFIDSTDGERVWGAVGVGESY